MNIILDFDDTLFNTQKVKEEVQDKFGLAWTPKQPEEFFKKAQELFDTGTKQYLFEDTDYFFATLKQKEYTLFLLSRITGSVVYSKYKISALNSYLFSALYVTSEKKEVFLKRFFSNNNQTIFINDKLEETMAVEDEFPNWKYIIKKAPHQKYPEQYKNFVFCNSLTEMLEYL